MTEKPQSRKSALGDSLRASGAKVAATPPPPPEPPPVPRAKPPVRRDTVPLTVHVPEEVRHQVKMLAVEKRRSMEALVCEALNLIFANYGKPEIAPRD